MKIARWIKEKIDAGDCLLALGLALSTCGIYFVFSIGWALIVAGGFLMLISYAGQATTLICLIFASARGQKK